MIISYLSLYSFDMVCIIWNVRDILLVGDVVAGAVAIMGHGWPGEIQKLDSFVHQRLHSGCRGVRHHK